MKLNVKKSIRKRKMATFLLSLCLVLGMIPVNGMAAADTTQTCQIPLCYQRHEYSAAHYEVKALTVTGSGNTAYRYCPQCGQYFKDEALTQVITREETALPATDVEYDLWVDGKQVTSENASDVLGDEDEGATVSYDAAANVLTLNQANITGIYNSIPEGYLPRYCGIYSNLDGMKLNLEGENTVDVRGAASKDTSKNEYCGIEAESMAVSGTGSLNVIGDDYGIYVSKALTVDSGTVTVKGRFGINGAYTNSEILTVNGGTVTGESTGEWGAGISVRKIMVTGGEVTGKCTRFYGYGISMEELHVSGGTVAGTSDKKGHGISGDDMTVTGGEVTGRGFGECYYGIDLRHSGSLIVSNGKVTGTSQGLQSRGIEAVDIEVSGGEVIGESTGADNKGINTWDDKTGGLTVKGGKVTGKATGERSHGLHVRAVQMTGGSIIAEGYEAAIVAWTSCDTEEDTKAIKLIHLPEGCLPAGNIISEITGYYNSSGYHFAAATFAAAGTEATYEEPKFLDAVTKITLQHEHSYDDWKSDETGHWKECACGEKTEEGSHTYGEWTVTKEPTSAEVGTKECTCTVCGYVQTETIAPEEEPAKPTESTIQEEPAKSTESTTETEPEKPMESTTQAELAKPTESTTRAEPEKGAVIEDEKSNSIYEVTGSTSVEYRRQKVTKTTVTIPASVTVDGKKYEVTSIATNAFKNNKKLKKVVIPSKISKIGKNAFLKCKNLKQVVIKTKKLKAKSVGVNAFKNISPKAVVKVPKGKARVYKKILRARGLSKRAKVK
ncbi:MAG: leucine-rich repeat protein [Eubacteriales bacterium]|nr:leucine-rich repeat protein [Eubacteriales bacterium]